MSLTLSATRQTPEIEVSTTPDQQVPVIPYGYHPREHDPDIQRLLETDKYTDLTMRCGGREFKVHRAIICPQSAVIETMCNSTFKEAETRVIEIEETDPSMLALMIEYIYNECYELPPLADEQSLDSPKTNSNLLTHARVYALADFYQVTDLKLYIRLTVSAMRPSGLETFEQLAEVVEQVYLGTPEQDFRLREAFWVMTQMDRKCGRKNDLRKSKRLAEAASKCPDYMELLDYLAKKTQLKRKAQRKARSNRAKATKTSKLTC